jgi:hypothetical protein
MHLMLSGAILRTGFLIDPARSQVVGNYWLEGRLFLGTNIHHEWTARVEPAAAGRF